MVVLHLFNGSKQDSNLSTWPNFVNLGKGGHFYCPTQPNLVIWKRGTYSSEGGHIVHIPDQIINLVKEMIN